MNKKNIRLQGLYGISDSVLTPHNTIMAQLQSAIHGGLRIFQYRDKHSKDSEIQTLVSEIQAMCREQNILFILNDRHELALKLGVDGLHLGRDEVNVLPQVRECFSGVIGVSCYDDIARARHFEDLGADYVAFGAFFPSSTKPNATRCDVGILEQAKCCIQIPICAIGGIRASNVGALQHCDMIAVIASLWGNCESDTKDFTFIQRNAETIVAAWKV